MKYATANCPCPDVTIYQGGRKPTVCACGNRYLSERELQRLHPAPTDEGDDRARRLRRPVEDPGAAAHIKRDAAAPSSTPHKPRRKAGLKRGRGLSASPEQQRATKGRTCIVCGRDGAEAIIDAAHVYPRRFAACDCAEGTVPLCRDDHRAFDEGHLDLLPHLLNHGLREELVHAIVEHEAPPLHLIEQVTGVAWQPEKAAK